MAMKTISVIVPVYNTADYLSKCVDSILNQTFQGFKIILCEDGSVDDTYKVAKSYAERYSNIVLIRNESNMGLNYSLNRCLEYADTEYCAVNSACF